MLPESSEAIIKDKLAETTFEQKSNIAGAHVEELVQIMEGTGTIFLGRILERAIQFLYIITVARMLGSTELFGLLMLGLTILNFANVISRFGLNAGTLRFVALYNGVGDKARVKGVIVQSLKFALVLSILVGLGLFLAAKPVLAKLFSKPELETVLKLLCLSMPFFALMTMSFVYTRGVQIMRYTVYGQNLFWPICNLLLAVIFFAMGFGLRGILAAHVTSVLLASVLSVCFLAKTFPALRGIEAIPETRKLLRFSVPLLLTIFLNFLIMWTDTLMLGYFRSSDEVGVYNAAIRTAMLISMGLLSFNSIFAPMISDLYNRKQMHKLSYLFKTTTKWIYTISCPVFLLMTFLSKEIMTIFGQEFLVGRNCLIVLAFAQLVNASVGSVGMLLIMSGKQDLMMYNTLGISIFNGLLNYLLIPVWGMLGAAIASGVSLIILNALMLVEVYILLKMHPYSRKFISPTLIAMIAFVSTLLVRSILADWAIIPRLLISIQVFALILVCLICKWGCHEEDRLIINTIQEKILRTDRISNKQK